jgi:tRNA (Thr-GGU) A37 N-methylase
MDEITYRPIRVIPSPFKELEGTPIETAGARAVAGTVEVFQEYVEGLKDIEGFSHIILLCHFHLPKGHPSAEKKAAVKAQQTAAAQFPSPERSEKAYGSAFGFEEGR